MSNNVHVHVFRNKFSRFCFASQKFYVCEHEQDYLLDILGHVCGATRDPNSCEEVRYNL